ADSNFAHPATRVDLGVKPFSDSLTIDNPHDVDWIRFRVPGPVAQAVHFETAPPTPLDTLGSSKGTGSNEALTLVLNPGDYYMVVTDFAGSPTRYSLCAAIGLS